MVNEQNHDDKEEHLTSLEEEEEEEDLFEESEDDDDDDDDEFELNEVVATETAVEKNEPQAKERVKKPETQPSPESMTTPSVHHHENEKESISVVPVPTATGKPFSLSNISITLTVELAQLAVTAQTLLDLQPGNMLDLKIGNNQVLLTVRDKVVGKGEIIKVGDMVGVRILEMGGY